MQTSQRLFYGFPGKTGLYFSKPSVIIGKKRMFIAVFPTCGIVSFPAMSGALPHTMQ